MSMRHALPACILSACASLAFAHPPLAGPWTGTLDGQPLAVTFDGRGGGLVDGRAIRYQVQGALLWIEDQGQVEAYQFQLQGNQLTVVGGQLAGPLTLTRGSASAAQAAAAPRAAGASPDLVGKWCKASSFSANAGGGSQTSACFELRADGSYVYGAERSASAHAPGAWGGTSSSSGDAGRWSATAGSITAHSRNGQVTTYRLERRNHPKNRDPMVCLDGECYVSYWQKAPW